MVVLLLIVLGLAWGSFVNALVFRVHEKQRLAASSKQIAKKGKSKPLSANSYQLTASDLSILKGRSMCPYCHHELAPQDLMPVFSWLWLKGRCRYCHEPISPQYPLVELLTAGLFVVSYLYWPLHFNAQGATLFVFWLVFLIGFMALAVYDLRWFLLPNKIVYSLLGLALVQVGLVALVFHEGSQSLLEAFWGVLIGGGIFYLLFEVSKGKWIGGGDVKLGTLLGLIVGGPAASFLLLFIASLLGTFVASPLLLTGKANRTTKLPFGPFLLAAAVIVRLFGTSIITWYRKRLLLG